MYELSHASVPAWTAPLQKWCPRSVDTRCPHCGRAVNFPLENFQWDDNRSTVSAHARCPGCGEKARFWIVDPGDGKDSSQKGCKGLFMFPQPSPIRTPVVPDGKLEVDALERTYWSAIAAYNAGLWDACATSCRKTLEGIVQTRMPEASGSLFNQLQAFFSEYDASEPLVHLADTLRKGGNLGAHFDLDREPDGDVATLMLDLLDYFFLYIYLLKDKSEELERRLASLPSNPSTQ
jgi:uncharacterized protein DUF4145